MGALLGRIEDRRRAPLTSPGLVASAVFYAGLLRIRSFNALEPRLREGPFVRLAGAPAERQRLCSADTVGRAIRKMDLASVRRVSDGIVSKAERNKVFREGWYGALRYVAIDGWEPFCSRHRHCSECLERQVRVKGTKGTSGDDETVIEYYHRYAVAMLIHERFDLVLGMEPLLPKALRPPKPQCEGKESRSRRAERDEGELTAATRLIERVKQTHPWIDVVVGDALYANGPFLSTLRRLGLGAVVVARKQTDEPLREALHLWTNQPPTKTVETPTERIALWDCHDLETLRTYKGKIRCVRGELTKLETPDEAPHIWCAIVSGKATRLAPEKVIAIARARWHIENTAFHQWTKWWHFDHVFVHHPNGINVLFWLFFAAFNLLTLYLYRQLRSYGRDRGKDVTRTISRLIDEMLDDLACWPVIPQNTS